MRAADYWLIYISCATAALLGTDYAASLSLTTFTIFYSFSPQKQEMLTAIVLLVFLSAFRHDKARESS